MRPRAHKACAGMERKPLREHARQDKARQEKDKTRQKTKRPRKALSGGRCCNIRHAGACASGVHPSKKSSHSLPSTEMLRSNNMQEMTTKKRPSVYLQGSYRGATVPSDSRGIPAPPVWFLQGHKKKYVAVPWQINYENIFDSHKMIQGENMLGLYSR